MVAAATATAAAVNPIISPSSSGEDQVILGNSSSPSRLNGPTEEMFDENDRLRKENVQLSKELTEMKTLCNNIFSIVSNYAGNQPKETGSSPAVKALDLLSSK